MNTRRKHPIVRQYDQIDCGPAALLSVLKFWGGDSSIVHVRELANTDAGGTNMAGLVQAAEALGLQAYGATGESEDLMKEKMPCIAHVMDYSILSFCTVSGNKVCTWGTRPRAYIVCRSMNF